MKKIIILVLLITGFANAQIVNIPDVNFKTKLLQASATTFIAQNSAGQNIKIDLNDDGEIQESEALLVSVLFLNYSNISNVTGCLLYTSRCV